MVRQIYKGKPYQRTNVNPNCRTIDFILYSAMNRRDQTLRKHGK